MASNEPSRKSIAQRFFDVCLLVLCGIVALWLALQFFAQFWGWIVLVVGIAGAFWVTILVVRARRDRW